jgi:hypothetical protein
VIAQNVLVPAGPEPLLELVGGAGARARATSVVGDSAFVVGQTGEGELCTVTAERHAGEWRFVGGGVGSGGVSINWTVSEVSPPGVLGVGGRPGRSEVRIAYAGGTELLTTDDGWFAWVRLGVAKESKPVVSRP